MTFWLIKKIFFFVFFLQFIYIQSQTRGVTYERNEDKSVTFTYFKNTPGSVYAILKFKQLTNANSDEIRRTIKGYGGRMLTLSPVNQKENIGFSYSSRSIIGNIEAEPDFQFKYVLPFKNEKEVKVRKLSYLGKRFGNSEPKNWTSFQFLTKLNDTVCAIRKGVVIRIKDEAIIEENDKLEYGYRNKVSSVLIEHDDGTLASYDVLKKDSFMVTVGDIVFPSTALALAGTYDKDNNSQIRLSVYYLDKTMRDYDFDERDKVSYGKQKHIYAYVNPKFYVNLDKSELMNLKANKSYKAFLDESIIQFEMSKREKKRWMKLKKLSKK